MENKLQVILTQHALLSSEDAKKLMEQVELLLTKVDTFVSQRLAEF